MYIAQQKRRENVAEYILYLWQLEDLIRALNFSGEAIWSALVEPTGRPQIEKQQLFVWYVEFSNLMKEEGKRESGHLQHTLQMIGELQQLSDQLLQLPAGREYKQLFEPLRDELPMLRVVLAKDGVSDIELCFRALYAAMLYRMKGEKNSSVEDVIDLISPVIALLADTYRRIERGETDIYRSASDDNNATQQ